MMHDWELVDEELIRTAAAEPDLLEPSSGGGNTHSRKLRRRVLRAARTAYRRRRLRRRILFAAALLLPAIAFGSWYHGFVGRRASQESAVWTSPATGYPGTPGEMSGAAARSHGLMLNAKPGEWDEVDASFEQRRERSKIIHSALY